MIYNMAPLMAIEAVISQRGRGRQTSCIIRKAYVLLSLSRKSNSVRLRSTSDVRGVDGLLRLRNRLPLYVGLPSQVYIEHNVEMTGWCACCALNRVYWLGRRLGGLLCTPDLQGFSEG